MPAVMETDSRKRSKAVRSTQKACQDESTAPSSSLTPSTASHEDNNKSQVEQPQPSAASSTATATSDAPRRGSASNIRVIAYNPPASAATAAAQASATPDSPEPRPSWEMRLAALRARRESASAERSLQTDLLAAGASAATTSAPAHVRASSSLTYDDVVMSSAEVARTRAHLHYREFSASPFSSVLSTPTSGSDSDTASHSPPPPQMSGKAATNASTPFSGGALVTTTTSSATFKEDAASLTSQPSRTHHTSSQPNNNNNSSNPHSSGPDGISSSLPPVPLAPRISPSELPPLAVSPTPSATSSSGVSPKPPPAVPGSASFAAANAAALHAAATAERPSLNSTRPGLRRLPSNMSAASTATFAEAPIAERSFGVFSWRDSPPSRPIRAAPMQSDSASSDEEEQVEVAIFEEEEDVEVDWYRGTPPLDRSATSPVPKKTESRDTFAQEAAAHFMEHIALLHRSTAPSAPTPSFVPSAGTAQPVEQPAAEESLAPQLMEPPQQQRQQEPSSDKAEASLSTSGTAAPSPSEKSGATSPTGHRRRYPPEKGVARRPGSARPKVAAAPLEIEQLAATPPVAPAQSSAAPESSTSPQLRDKAKGEVQKTLEAKQVEEDSALEGAKPTRDSAPVALIKVSSAGKPTSPPPPPTTAAAAPAASESNKVEKPTPLRRAYPPKQQSTPALPSTTESGSVPASLQPTVMSPTPSEREPAVSSTSAASVAQRRAMKDGSQKEKFHTAAKPNGASPSSVPLTVVSPPPQPSLPQRKAAQQPSATAKPSPKSDNAAGHNGATTYSGGAPPALPAAGPPTSRKVPNTSELPSPSPSPQQVVNNIAAKTQPAPTSAPQPQQKPGTSTTREHPFSNTPRREAAQRSSKPAKGVDDAPPPTTKRADPRSQHSGVQMAATASVPAKDSASTAHSAPPPSSSSMSSTSSTAMRPPPLTQFRVPREMESATRPVGARPAAGSAASAAISAPPARQKNVQASQSAPTAQVPAAIAVVAPEPQREDRPQGRRAQHNDPGAISSSSAAAAAAPPPPRLTQKPQLSLRPLLSQLVSKAMSDSPAGQDGCSVSSTTPTSSVFGDGPTPSVRRFCSAVATPSDFAQPHVTPATSPPARSPASAPASVPTPPTRSTAAASSPQPELTSPAPVGPRPRAPSPGSSPEAVTSDSRSPRSPSTYALQPRSVDSRPLDWHASLVAGVRLHRDSPHTSRPRGASRERSQSGRVTAAWSTASPGAWDGLMRSASTERDAALLTESGLPSGHYATFRRGGPASAGVSTASAPANQSPAAGPSRVPVTRPLLSTAIYPVFHATTVGSKYTLADPTPATTSMAMSTDDLQVLREELELQSRLNKLKADSLRRRAERNYY